MPPEASEFAGAMSGPPELPLLQLAVYAFIGMTLLLMVLVFMACCTLPIFFGALYTMEGSLRLSQNLPDPVGKYSKLFGLVFRSLRRNLLRTALTYIALFVLTGVLTMIFSIVNFLGDFTAEKEGSQLVLMTNKFGIPSVLRPGYASQLKSVLEKLPPSYRPRPYDDAKRAQLGIPPAEIGSIPKEEVDRLFIDELNENRPSAKELAQYAEKGILNANDPEAKQIDQLKTYRLNQLVEKGLIPATASMQDKEAKLQEMQKRLRKLTDVGIEESFMTWTFVGATLDPEKRTKENSFFLFALDPKAVSNGMMDGQGLSKEALGEEGWNEILAVVEVMNESNGHIVVGEDRLKIWNKQVGDSVEFVSTNYTDLKFNCKIVGAFPSNSRLANAAAMRYDYLQLNIDEYRAKNGKDHPLAEASINLIWVRMPSKPAFETLSSMVNDGGVFNSPAAKMELFSSAVGTFLEPYKDIFWGMKYIIMPAIVAIMCLVVGITITIGVRERWVEMAVLKVMGFQPWQVVTMIISESCLIGIYGGMLSTWSVYFLPLLISKGTKAVGVKFAFFDNFNSPWEIVIYGPLLGIFIGIVGSALPSMNVRKIKVSNVFSQVS